jgi:DNA repair exonuclease SbcCD ATPase subunit
LKSPSNSVGFRQTKAGEAVSRFDPRETGLKTDDQGTEMSDISELESRITAALDRIAWSVENGLDQPANTPTAVPAPAPSGDGDLAEELEIERATNQKLSAASAENMAQIERLEVRVSRLADKLEQTETENKRLENVIETLSQNNDALREANAAYQGDADSADAGAKAQLDHLRALRDADRGELDDIMAELAPIVKEG